MCHAMEVRRMMRWVDECRVRKEEPRISDRLTRRTHARANGRLAKDFQQVRADTKTTVSQTVISMPEPVTEKLEDGHRHYFHVEAFDEKWKCTQVPERECQGCHHRMASISEIRVGMRFMELLCIAQLAVLRHSVRLDVFLSDHKSLIATRIPAGKDR
jgi:hypothetical protein